MAQYVNLQQTEMDEIQKKLETLHIELLHYEQIIRDEILKLSSMEGGFYVTEISDKISLLLSELASTPIEQLSNTFTATEAVIETFVATVKETDDIA